LAGLPLMIAGAIVIAWPSIADMIYEQLGLGPNWYGEEPETGPGGVRIPGYGNPPIWHPPAGEGITTGSPISDWFTSQPWWPFAEGGIVTSPTLALIGEAGPEAVIPLDKLKGRSASNVTNHFSVTIAGSVYGIDDLERKMEQIVDEYSSKIRSA